MKGKHIGYNNNILQYYSNLELLNRRADSLYYSFENITNTAKLSLELRIYFTITRC